MADTEEFKVFDGCGPHFFTRQYAYRAIEGIVASTDHAAGQHAERKGRLGGAIAKGLLAPKTTI